MGESKSLFQIERDGSTVVLTPLVNLSDFLFESTDQETEALMASVSDPEVTAVVADLRHTNYFGTDFLSILLRLWRQIRERDGRLALCNVSASEREILSICQLNTLWTICDSLDEAIANASQDE